jgi:hypothetical protein
VRKGAGKGEGDRAIFAEDAELTRKGEELGASKGGASEG